MANRSTIQHQLSRQKQRPQDNHERFDGQRSLPRVLGRLLRGSPLRDERWRKLLYLSLRPRNGELQDGLHGNRAWSQRVLNMEQGQLGVEPTRLSLEARAMSLRMEGRHAPLVFRPQTNHRHQLGASENQQGTPDNEASWLGRLLDPKQHQKGRQSSRQLRRFWDDTHSLRANRPHLLHDGTGSTLLRCRSQTLLETSHRRRGRLGRRDESTMSKMRLPEGIEKMKDGPHKRDLIRKLKRQRREYYVEQRFCPSTK